MPKKSTPHTRLKALFAQRLAEELNLVVISTDIKGCGWNQKGTLPAPHVYRMVFGLSVHHLTVDLLTQVQVIWDDCLLQNDPPMCTIPIHVPGSYPLVSKPQPLHYCAYGTLRATVCTQDYFDNRVFYDQKARDDYQVKVAEIRRRWNDPVWLAEREIRWERKAARADAQRQRMLEERARVQAIMETPEYIQSRITYWRENHGLLPPAPYPHDDCIIVWKHVMAPLSTDTSRLPAYSIKPVHGYWFGEIGAPHKVGDTFHYTNEGNACVGPYGALKRSPLPSSLPNDPAAFLTDDPVQYGGYVAAIAIQPVAVGVEGPTAGRSSVLIDHHSEGVVTFKHGYCIAVYHGTIDDKTQELTLRLIEGEDVLPLIQPTTQS